MEKRRLGMGQGIKGSRITSKPSLPKKIKDEEKEPEPKYISGPVSWSYFEFNGKRFHFFGDEHGSIDGNCESLNINCTDRATTDCFDIVFLLENVFQDKNKFIDLFIELPYLSSDQELNIDLNDRREGYIKNITQRFHKCFQRNKDLCPYQNVRFHYVDIRQDLNIPGGLGTIYNYLMSLWTEVENRFLNLLLEHNPIINKELIDQMKFINSLVQILFDRYPNFHRELFYDILTQSSVSYIQRMKSFYEEHLASLNSSVLKEIFLEHPKRRIKNGNIHLIRKQLEELKKDNLELKGKNIADSISNFIWKEYDQLEMNIKEPWNQFYKIFLQTTGALQDINQNKSSDDIVKKLEIFQIIGDTLNHMEVYRETMEDKKFNLVRADMLWMDVYTLTRMFRNYSSSKSPIESNIVITYTGELHRMNFAKFFQHVLQVNPVFEERGMSQARRCIQTTSYRINNLIK
jgi:hypothetical protein